MSLLFSTPLSLDTMCCKDAFYPTQGLADLALIHTELAVLVLTDGSHAVVHSDHDTYHEWDIVEPWRPPRLGVLLADSR